MKQETKKDFSFKIKKQISKLKKTRQGVMIFLKPGNLDKKGCRCNQLNNFSKISACCQ